MKKRLLTSPPHVASGCPQDAAEPVLAPLHPASILKIGPKVCLVGISHVLGFLGVGYVAASIRRFPFG